MSHADAFWENEVLGTRSIYTRNSNPTIHVFEEKVRLLEEAEAATSAASGMGIISSTLFALLEELWGVHSKTENSTR